VAGVQRGEAWLLLAASTVLLAGIVSAVAFVVGDDVSSPGAVPSGAPSLQPPSSASPSPSAAPALTVSGVRITTYSRGSHQLVVRVRVNAGTAAAVEVDGRSYPLQLVDGEATGTVPLRCDGSVPELVLVVTSATGEQQRTSLGRPAAAVAAACGTPLRGGPVPSGTPRGS
jgi:hypothetical protein